MPFSKSSEMLQQQQQSDSDLGNEFLFVQDFLNSFETSHSNTNNDLFYMSDAHFGAPQQAPPPQQQGQQQQQGQHLALQQQYALFLQQQHLQQPAPALAVDVNSPFVGSIARGEDNALLKLAEAAMTPMSSSSPAPGLSSSMAMLSGPPSRDGSVTPSSTASSTAALAISAGSGSHLAAASTLAALVAHHHVNQEQFLLTAADPADGPPEDRLSQILQAKYAAGLLKPYNYVSGYERFQRYIEVNLSTANRQRVLTVLNSFRPAFRAVAQLLTDLDLILVEEAFERLLLVRTPSSDSCLYLHPPPPRRTTTGYSPPWASRRRCGGERARSAASTRSLRR